MSNHFVDATGSSFAKIIDFFTCSSKAFVCFNINWRLWNIRTSFWINMHSTIFATLYFPSALLHCPRILHSLPGSVKSFARSHISIWQRVELTCFWVSAEIVADLVCRLFANIIDFFTCAHRTFIEGWTRSVNHWRTISSFPLWRTGIFFWLTSVVIHCWFVGWTRSVNHWRTFFTVSVDVT